MHTSTSSSSMHIMHVGRLLPCVSAFTGGTRTSSSSNTRACYPLDVPASLLSEQAHVRGINNCCARRASSAFSNVPSSASASSSSLLDTALAPTLTSLSSTSTGTEHDETAANAATEEGGGGGGDSRKSIRRDGSSATSDDGVRSKSQVGSNKSNSSKRRPAPNKRIGLKWVVESVEKCLIEEKGYKSGHRDENGSDNNDATSTSDWDEGDVQLVGALWKLCWGECMLVCCYSLLLI